MREDDIASNDVTKLELGHVYSKLEGLEKEQKEIARGLHDVQLELARGRRFPLAMYGFLGTLTLAVAGAAFVLHAELKLNTAAVEQMPELRERLTSAFNGMRAAEQAKASILEEHTRMRGVIHDIDRRCCLEMPVLSEKVKNLEGRIVGKSGEGWHRSDHDLYAQMVDVKLGAIMQHIEHIEARNKVADGNWDKVRARGLLVEPTGGKQ